MSTPPARSLQIFFYGDPNGYPPIINAARCLAKSGWKVAIVCRAGKTHPDVAFPQNVVVTRLASSSTHSWTQFASFAWAAVRRSDRNASIFAGHDMHGLVVAAFAGLYRRIPFIYHCHDFADDSRELPAGSSLVRRLERCFARRAAMTVVPDRNRAEVVARQLKLRASPLIVPNSPCRIDAPNRGTLRARLGEMGFAFDGILLRQGRIGPGHGILATLHSMPSWEDRNWGFVALGPAEEDFAAELRAVARDLGVADRFVIIPTVGYDELPKYTIDADIGHALYEPVNLNHVEVGTASNKTLEYMASGIPCIVSSSSSSSELIDRFRFGVTAFPTDAADIARAVNALAANPSVRAEMAVAGKTAFATRFCYELHFEELERRLRALIEVSAA